MTEINYENGKPTFKGNNVVKCFNNDGNGLLFRIINEKKKQWAFYNDTKDYNMIVQLYFGRDSKVRPLGKTKMETDSSTGDLKCELNVPPLKTEVFIEGSPNGYRLKLDADPIDKS
ncbi:calpain-like cysteine peptidase [Trypanosoma theileri]|uniref:Calpain-like cysteine peptidase n=1 Tax=Trypanosoma theileri TaxID=67003 RepID=A0A1X0NNW3_9TRYP|nr:calpain-like cysteine peptidase [Trypanosoma theileri]ORC86291.1 calpain-like cysteine peptidase [Trypanosoma theileri]